MVGIHVLHMDRAIDTHACAQINRAMCDSFFECEISVCGIRITDK